MRGIVDVTEIDAHSVVLVAASATFVHAQSPALSNADTSAITALSESFSKALLAKDWKGVSALAWLIAIQMLTSH